MVPAAVIIMGRARGEAVAPSRTAAYPARFVWDDRASMLWVSVERGMASIASAGDSLVDGRLHQLTIDKGIQKPNQG